MARRQIQRSVKRKNKRDADLMDEVRFFGTLELEELFKVYHF